MDLASLIADSPLTQAALARVLGVSRATVHSWITRERIPAEQLAGVVVALGLDDGAARALYEANGVPLPPVLGGRVVEAVAGGL